MARASWQAVRAKAQAASFDYYKEPLRVRSGQADVSLSGVLDTNLDDLAEGRVQGPEGTFPVMAKLSLYASELGWIPVTGEELRVSRDAAPEYERLYLVVTVDDTTDLIDIELQAQAYHGRPYNH